MQFLYVFCQQFNKVLNVKEIPHEQSIQYPYKYTLKFLDSLALKQFSITFTTSA